MHSTNYILKHQKLKLSAQMREVAVVPVKMA